MPYTPTVRGRRVARELKRLRLKAGLTGEQAIAEIGWDTAKLSRMENAKMRITSGEVMELLEVYGITGEQRTELVRLAREARQKGWWHSYDVLKSGFNDYLAFEAEALTYRTYQTTLIPGILQTPDYARAVLSGSQPRTPEEIERGVEVRQARQKRITASDQPLHVWAIIDEAALHRLVDCPTVLKSQLEGLLDLGGLANVSIQVLPYRAGIHAAIDGPFILLTFDGYPEVLYMEHLMGCMYMEKPTETRRGNLILDHLLASALNTGDSARLIHHVAGALS
ncbi:helix-turn-helix domain-containing protein [Actinomadura xylanilytica]|uniref:helix-turn-helix domain-containing protein n=1 Tax=Actinomadura xylanilytica TaxID=887459 RepID=UPI00255AF791|nr:helix-turn-helix transcriptional regulator [Actinomadura xylanilytica]MDL4776242.1 helix-turn-helix transcriptional regulator [Actinomadura xylanilytica]